MAQVLSTKTMYAANVEPIKEKATAQDDRTIFPLTQEVAIDMLDWPCISHFTSNCPDRLQLPD